MGRIDGWSPDPTDKKAALWGVQEDGRRVSLKVTRAIMEAIRACPECKETPEGVDICPRHIKEMQPTEVGTTRSEGTHRRRGFR